MEYERSTGAVSGRYGPQVVSRHCWFGVVDEDEAMNLQQKCWALWRCLDYVQ